MVANKMTGPKGVIFTAKYIDRFHEYEDRLKAQELQGEIYTVVERTDG